jgi:hypothetical protein
MAIKVSIYFTGLCYFVNNGDGKTANVVFPNALREKVAETKDNGDEMIIPSHRVYVRYRVDQVDKDNTDTNPQVFFTKHDINYAAYLLAGENIVVNVSLDGSQPVCFASSPATPSNPPSNNDRLPFSKIVNLKKDVSQDCGSIKDEFVTDNPPIDKIHGRLDVSMGCLAATFADPQVGWEFKPDALNPASRYLAQMVSWDLKTTDGKAMLAFIPFVGADVSGHKLTLRENASALDIEIGNAPIADLVGAGKRDSGPDHHFEVYYRLVKQRPAYYLVVPYSDALSPQGSNCPPVQEKP